MNMARSLCVVSFLVLFSQISKNCDAKVIPTESYYIPLLKDDVHSCRHKCISEILGDSTWHGELMTYLRCRGTPNCYMCWDYCRAFSVADVNLATSMCNDKHYCLKGCKVACYFYKTTTIYDVIENLSWKN